MNRSAKTLRFAVITTFILLATFDGAAAQNPYQDLVIQQLARFAAHRAQDGYQLSHGPEMSALAHGQREQHRITLRSGTEYLVFAAGDHDCGDVDLEIYDENGNHIDTDNLRDDIPVLTIRPRWTGPFLIQANMYHCRNSPCHYGVAAVARSTTTFLSNADLDQPAQTTSLLSRDETY